MQYFRILSIIIIGILTLSSCGDDDTELSINPGDELTGFYSGTIAHRAAYEEETITSDEKPLVVSRHEHLPKILNVSIENFSWIVVLDRITHNGGNKFSGAVYLYNSTQEIGAEGKEVAGAGSFFYENDKLTLLWTADYINDEWTFSYSGERN